MNRAERRRAEREMAKMGPVLRAAGKRVYDGLPVQVRDQHAAAEAEAVAVQRKARRLLGWRGEEARRDSEILPILLMAMATRVREFCSHVGKGPVVGDLTFVSLSRGFASCRRCLLRYRDQPFTDDGRCDVCDLPAPDGIFTEHQIQGGAVLWHLNVGECCEDVLMGAMS